MNDDNPLRMYWETMPPLMRNLVVPVLFGLLFLLCMVQYVW